MDWPFSSWGYGLALFRLGIWIGPFPIGDMDEPLSSPFPIGDMERLFSSWGYGLAPFRLGISTSPFRAPLVRQRAQQATLAKMSVCQCPIVTCRRWMCTYAIENHMREHHPKSDEVVFVLSAAERATVIAQSEPKTKKGCASNPQFKVPQSLPPPMASAMAHRSASGSSNKSNNSNSSNSSSSNSSSSSGNTSGPSGSEYSLSESALDAGPRVVTLHSKQPLPKEAIFRNTAPKRRKIATKARLRVTYVFMHDT